MVVIYAEQMLRRPGGLLTVCEKYGLNTLVTDNPAKADFVF